MNIYSLLIHSVQNYIEEDGYTTRQYRERLDTTTYRSSDSYPRVTSSVQRVGRACAPFKRNIMLRTLV